MNSLTESPSCLQKVRLYQLILRRAESLKQAELMFLTYVATLLANCSDLLDASPKNLYKVDWIAAGTCESLRKYFIRFIAAKIARAPGFGQITDLVDCSPEAFEAAVFGIASEQDAHQSTFDNPKFTAFLQQVGMDASEMADEDLEKLRVEFYYIN